MPSTSEISEHVAKYGVRVWGVSPNNVSDPCRLGDVAVIPWDDHIAAVEAARGAKR